MCRWLAYSGPRLRMSELLFEPVNSLIRQSLLAQRGTVPTNGDGFGLGWYGERRRPGLFRDTLPAWNDANLHDLAQQIAAPLFFAHVRASTGTATSRDNCHPFRLRNLLFMHNGEIGDFMRIRRDVEHMIKPGWDDISAVRVEPADEIPAYTDEQTIARSALDAFLAIEDVYPFLHQGIVGHLLTHAHALIDLARLGYLDLAAKGHEAHRLFIKLSRNSPDEGEPISRDNALDRFEPTTAAFWQTDHEGGREWLVGHVFKYTYSFYDLIQHVDDENKRNALEAHLAYVLAST